MDVDKFHSFADVSDIDWLKYDIAFLDMEIGDKLGVDLAVMIRVINKHVLIFFITNHHKYISDAFKSLPFQYLIKPINDMEFKREFARALDEYTKIKSAINLIWQKHPYTLSILDIEYIESINRKREVVMNDNIKNYTMSTIKELDQKIHIFGFVKCHSSFIINIRSIKIIDKNTLITKSGKVIPISRHCYDTVKKAFMNRASGGVI